jgi:hypothetical protein
MREKNIIKNLVVFIWKGAGSSNHEDLFCKCIGGNAGSRNKSICSVGEAQATYAC